MKSSDCPGGCRRWSILFDNKKIETRERMKRNAADERYKNIAGLPGEATQTWVTRENIEKRRTKNDKTERIPVNRVIFAVLGDFFLPVIIA